MDSAFFGMAAALALGYLLGSISFAHLTARYIMHTDVEELSAGFAGASTVYRRLGARAGAITIIGDFSKSALAVFLAQRLVPNGGMLAGAAAVAGHNWPVFYGFKGGKGVAAAAGAILMMVPVAFAVALMLGAVAFYFTRNSLVTSAAVFVPVIPLAWILAYPTQSVAYTLALPGMVTIYTWLSGRHRPLGERWRKTFMRRRKTSAQDA